MKVSKGDLHSEDNLLDKSLYGEKPIDPEGDDDHDGIKNKDELYVYNKNGKEYLGYYSHPLLEDSDGDGLLDNEDDHKNNGMLLIETQFYLWNCPIVMMIILKKF